MDEPGIEGKKVEFIPTHNYKLGTRFGFKKLLYEFTADKCRRTIF